MTQKELLIIGAGGHARSCIDVISLEGKYRIAGLIGLKNELGSYIMGHQIIGNDSDLSALSTKYRNAFIAIGQIANWERYQIYQKLKQLGYELPTIVSPLAYVARSAQVEAGTIVMHGAILNAESKIGKNCIINSRVLIEHDAIVGDHCHISTGAILNGAVTIGPKSFVGSGSIVKQGIQVGESCVVGMGLFLRRNLQNQEIFLGDGVSK